MRVRSKTLLIKVFLIAVIVSLGVVVLAVSMSSDVVGVLGLVAGNIAAEINVWAVSMMTVKAVGNCGVA